MTKVDDEKPITIGEFSDLCVRSLEEIYQALDAFDDETDPAGIAEAILSKYIEHYFGLTARGEFK